MKNKYFAENLQKLRKENKYTQTELGKMLNLSQKAISHYEKGETEPDIENLIKISNIFRISIDYLVGKYKTDDLSNNNKKIC